MKKAYSCVSMKPETAKRLKELHKRFCPRMTYLAFLDELGDVFEKKHCAECGVELGVKPCGCKDSDKF